jgi:NDP-sugar pyrophosphorylase family protein
MKKFAAAMVLAAGRGERMRPLSDVLPKPALPLVDGPVITSALRLAARTGSARIVVNTWHLQDLMATAVAAATTCEMTVDLSPETSLMGTAGGLAMARDRGLLGAQGPVLVINGDGLSELEITPLLERHSARGDAVTLGLLPHPDPTRWSRVLVDPQGTVVAIRPSADVPSLEISWLYPGVMAVSRDALNAIPSTAGEIPNRLWYPALAGGRLGGVSITGTWREVGTAEDYLDVITDQLDGKNFIHPTACVAETASIGGSFIGHHAKVGDRSVVLDSVVTNGASLGIGSHVAHSVLLGRTECAAGERLKSEYRVGPVADG